MRCLYLVMALAQSSLPPYTSLLSAGPSTPWKGVSVQLTCERPVLLRSFFSDAEFVVSELQVGNVIAAGARARLLGCASEYGKSQGLPAPPLPPASLPAATSCALAASPLLAML